MLRLNDEKDGRWKRLVKLPLWKGTILAVGICFVVAVIFFFAKDQRTELSLPKDILQLHLNEEIRGEQAREIVNRMHRKSVTPAENVIGMYQSPNGSASLYLSHYNSFDAASKQFEKMAMLIRDEEGNVFSDFREIQVGGKKLYFSLGLGQAHYFFLTRKDLFWLAVDTPIAQASIQELVRIVHAVDSP